ncbi:MAG TPA: hypothetical protein PKY82_18980 [Pyrinomonadaceae bacterium]|nr:hypothetical protein [Pyrinomonadaceae bacterium]
MRHEILAKEDVDDRIGDRHYVVKVGETIEVSAKGVEVALSTGKFEYVKEVPETAIEKKRAEAAAKAQSEAADQVNKEQFENELKPLLAMNKEDLLKKAEEMKLEGFADLKKEPLAKLIAEALVKGGVK